MKETYRILAQGSEGVLRSGQVERNRMVVVVRMMMQVVMMMMMAMMAIPPTYFLG